MAAMGVTTFIEIGPGRVLSGLIKRILPDAVTMNVYDPKSLEATRTALSA
jgi:[acyl-carrier-protein] S-malonyltransferase